MRSLVTTLAILVLVCAALLPRALPEEYRGTEGRRVQIALEMRASGDFMVPTLGQEPTLAKPPLFYWTLAGLHEALGTKALVARLPALLAFAGLAFAGWRFLRRHHGERVAGIGVLCLLASPVLVFDAPSAEIDPMFAALTGLSVLAVADGIATGKRSAFVLGGLWGGLALLTKGPPYFLFLAGPLLLAWRARRLGGMGLTLLVAVALTAAYYVPLVPFRVPLDEFARIARAESIGRAGAYGLENLLDVPPFLLRCLALCLPALGFAAFARREDTDPGAASALATRTLAAATIGGVLLLLLFPGRPTRYVLPAIALANLGLAPRVAASLRGGRPLGRAARLGCCALGIACGLAFAAAPLVRKHEVLSLLPFAAFLALAFPLVTTRLRLFALLVAAPLVAAWCVHATPFAQAPSVNALAGRELARQVAARGIAGRVQTYGHVPAPSLLAGELMVPGDEARARPPAQPFLIVEDVSGTPAWDAAESKRHRHLVRVRLTDKSLVLQEQR